MTSHDVVDRAAWTQARIDFMAKEKEFTRRRDELSQERRDLPWSEVSADYAFATEDGERSLLDMFDGKDAEAVDAARARWRTAQAAGNTVKYWKQDDAGRWEQAAEG